MSEPMPPEDEQRIRELLDIHPALLQSEAIELRRHLLDAREDLAAVRAELRSEKIHARHFQRSARSARSARWRAVKRYRKAEAERDRLRTELEDLAAQNAKTESNFEEFAEDIIPERDRFRALVEKAHGLRQDASPADPAWRAWDRDAEHALRGEEAE